MPLALPRTALVNSDDIVRDAINSLGIDTAGNADAITRAIMDTTGLVEDWCHRKFIVREYSQTINFYQYNIRWGFDNYEAFLDDYPLVQIISAVDQDGTDVSSEYSLHTVTRCREHKLLAETARTVLLTYFAGYRATEEVSLADLQVDLPGLTREPDVLPWAVRSVTTELVLHRLTLAANQQFGVGRQIQSIGSEGVELDKPDRNFIEDRLRTLTEHKRYC